MAKVKYPLVLINFKAYESATGDKAVKLAKICERVAKKYKKPVALAVSALDLRAVVKATTLPVFAQHVDPVGYGAHTGWLPPKEIKRAGAVGTLINHAEHKLPFATLKETVKQCEEEKLLTCVCAASLAEAKKVATLKSTMVAYEPPSLIGGDISVSTAKPAILKQFADHFKRKKTVALCGAGVKTAEDVKIALQLNTEGILLASGITKAKNPAKVLGELLEAM